MITVGLVVCGVMVVSLCISPSEQLCSLMYPQLVLGAHGDAGGLPRCLLRCR